MKFKYISIISLIFILFLGFKFNAVYFLKDQFIKSDLSYLYINLFRGERVFDQDHVITTLDNGMKIIVNKHDQSVCRFVRITGHWDSSEKKVLDKIVQPGFRIIEVGANFGVFTLQMAELVGKEGKVFAFEANPHVSKYLKKSVELNKLENQIQVSEMAASHKPYNGFMIYNLDNIGAGYILPDTSATRQQCQTTSCVPIKVSTLDLEIKETKIDMLKMDAEGAESWILEGAASILHNNPDLIIMLEWVPGHIRRNGIALTEFINYLKKLDMKFWQLGKNGSLIPISPDDLEKQGTADIILAKENILKKYVK